MEILRFAGDVARRFTGLAVLVLFTLVVVASTFVRDWDRVIAVGGKLLGTGESRELPLETLPKAVVSVVDVSPQPIDITDRYSGMVRPWERYTLAFEVPGRVRELGASGQGVALDEGDRVTASQVIAQLDDRLLVAQFREATANLEQAQSDLHRATELRDRDVKSITEAEYQSLVTQVALSEARREIAQKHLDDATLRSPVAGVISKRMLNAGESINMHMPVFEIVEVDRVLLVVGVPESRVRSIKEEQPVRVEFTGRDRFRREGTPADGRVFRVSQTADDKTGLFEVEIEIPNADGAIRPGLIGVGEIVVEHLEGFRVPFSSVVFRDRKAMIFSVGEDDRAHPWELHHWVEQGPDIVFDELPNSMRRVVVRGQHRLMDGREVEITKNADAAPLAPTAATARIEPEAGAPGGIRGPPRITPGAQPSGANFYLEHTKMFLLYLIKLMGKIIGNSPIQTFL